LEALERRLLLSADGLSMVAAIAMQGNAEDDQIPVVEVQMEACEAAQNQLAQNGGDEDSIFNVESQTVVVDDIAVESDSDLAPDGSSDEGGPIDTAEQILGGGEEKLGTSQLGQNGGAELTNLKENAGGAPAVDAAGNPMTQQMVLTLRAANGPPAVTELANGGRFINLRPENAHLFGNQLVVNPGDILKGTGGNIFVVNNGYFAPGNSPGQTNYPAGFAQGAAGTTQFEIEGLGQGTTYDWVNVTGNVTLDGKAEIAVGALWTPVAGQSYTVLTWTGTRTGEFANWRGTVANAAGDLLFVPVYDDALKQLRLEVKLAPGYNPIKTQVENLLTKVGEVGDKLDQVGAFINSIPFIDRTGVDDTIGAILDQGKALKDVLTAHLQSLAGTLTVADVTQALEDLDGDSLLGYNITVHGVLAKFGNLITQPFSWDLDISFTRNDAVNFTLGSTAALSGSITASGTFTTALRFDFTFGKDATDYYVKVDRMNATATLTSVVAGNVSVTLPAGVTSLTANGPANISASVLVTPNASILTSGKIYLATLTGIGNGSTSAVTNFTFTPTGSINVDLTLSATSVNLGGGITLGGGVNAKLTIVGANFFTTAPDVDFKFVSATLSAGVSLPGIQGTFNINTDGTTTYIEATITQLRFSMGPTRVFDLSGTASFVLANSELAGKADLSLVLGPAAGLDLTMSGTWHLEINTSADAISVPYLGGTVSVPGGDYLRVELENGSLGFTINPTFNLTGDFVFEQNGSGATAVVAVGASDVNFSFGDDSHPNLVTISNGAGILVLINGGMAGNLTGTLTETLPLVDIAGTFSVVLNDTGGAVNKSVTVGGVTQTIDLAAGLGNYLKITGTNTTVTAAGVTLTGNFTYENYNTGPTSTGPKVIAVGATNVSGSLTVGAAQLVSLSNGSGGFLITNDGIAGTATVTYALSVPSVSVATAGTATLKINQTNALVNTVVDIDGVNDVPINVVAGPYFRIETVGATLQLLGANGINVSGNFAYERFTTQDGETVVKVAASNANLQMGDGSFANLVSVSNASGYFLFTEDGMAGKASGTVTIAPALTAEIVGVTGVFSILINTTDTAVDEDFTINAATVAVEAPAGPYVRISGMGVALTLNFGAIGNVVVNGDFSFEQKKTGATLDYIKVGGANISATLSNAAGFDLQVTGGSGGFLLNNTGLAGEANVSLLTFEPITGVSVTASNIIFRINNTNADVASTTVDVNGTDEVTFEFTGAYYRRYVGVSAAVTLSLTGFTDIEGQVSFEQANVSGSNIIRIAAEDVSAEFKFGSGPALISFYNGEGAFVLTSAGIAGTARLEFQTGFVSVSGTISLEVNTTAVAANYSWLAPDGSTYTIALTNANYFLVCVNGHVQVGSFDIPVNFQIRKTAGGLYFETKGASPQEIFHLTPTGAFVPGSYITFPTDIDFANPSPEDILTFLQRSIL
jgi:hypothetical protein